jgi:hypothetical protein
MATFEQALSKAFEVAWLRGQDADLIREKKGVQPQDPMDQLIVEGIEQAFTGALDVLGSLLYLAGRIKSFEVASRIDDDGELKGTTTEWVDGSTAALGALTEWAHDTGRMTDVEYAGYRAIYGTKTGI